MIWMRALGAGQNKWPRVGAFPQLLPSIAALLRALPFIASLSCNSAQAVEPDNVTGLPTDITPLLSEAGRWQPVSDQDVAPGCNGAVSSTFAGVFTTDSTLSENVLITGWSYCGFDNTATKIAPVNLAMFHQQPNGTLTLANARFISDPVTNGGGSVLVADFNKDGFPDIFLAAHNESPFIAMPSTALLSNGGGGFNKVTLTDRIMAHDAELTTIDGVLTVITKTFSPGEKNPMFQFRNGAFTKILPPNLSSDNIPGVTISGQSIAIAEFQGPGKYQAVFGDLLFGPGVPWAPPPEGPQFTTQRIAVYPFVNGDYVPTLLQVVGGYHNSRPQFANVRSAWGLANTHTYRMRVEDFNHDGAPDIFALASLWTTQSEVFPSAIQLLQNDGTGKFTDVSDTFAARINPQTTESDYSMQIRDLDDSGINSFASAWGNHLLSSGNQVNYLLVNDGSGDLRPALFHQFTAWGIAVSNYVDTLGYPVGGYVPHPRFIPYRTANGKINFLATTSRGITKNGSPRTLYFAINVPVQLDLAAQYKTSMTVANRNGSRRIRTFGGDDTIHAGRTSATARVDGGPGTDRVIYTGVRANYTINQNMDGSWQINDTVGSNGKDTLLRVEFAQFADMTVPLSSSIPLAGGAIFSTAQRASQSLLRFFNTGATAGTATATLRDAASGASLGQWTSPSIPPGAVQQFHIGTIENAALSTGTSKPENYSLSLQSNITGTFQHVIAHPSGIRSNHSSCPRGVTADPMRLSAVNTATVASAGFASTVVMSNTGSAAGTVSLGVYDARNGNKLGTFVTPSIPANAQAFLTVASIEAGASVTPTAEMYHYVIRAEGTFAGFLQHLITNQDTGIITDMTRQCSLDGSAAAAPTSPLRVGAVFSTTNTSAQSLLRFHNTGTNAGRAIVTLRNSTTGLTLGQWTGPSIPAGSQQQYYIGTLEAALPSGTIKPAYYAISVETNFTGSFQHVLAHPDGVRSNLSTCSSGVTADPLRLSAVNTSTVGAAGFSSVVVVNNTSGSESAVSLGLYDARNGAKLGTYVSTLRANAQASLAVATLEAGAGVTPTADMYHYIIKAEAPFGGFLQHLITNRRAGTTTDMTGVCTLPVS